MQRWSGAVGESAAPLAVADLEAFDANADDLARRAGRLPIRVATKSLRCRALIARALEHPGFRGVMAYSLPEALWLTESGLRDVMVAYPSVHRAALARLAETPDAVTVTIDSREHVDLLSALRPGCPYRVCLDVDVSYRLGPVHLGVRRSPLRTPDETADLVGYALRRGLRVVGLMFYDAHIAGVADRCPAVHAMQRRAIPLIRAQRAQVVDAVRSVVDLEFVNAGGTGSLHTFTDDQVVTELAAGSGLFGPGLFQQYRSFTPRPAVGFGLEVVRRPAANVATLFSGGYIASGAAGPDRLPTPLTPGLRLVRLEGAGEVQTPVTGRAARHLRLGDLVWFQHAKAGELFERFTAVHLLTGNRVQETVHTYRGEGKSFG